LDKYLEIDKKYERPTEVDALIGDASKAEKELGWKAKTHWKELAELMVDADLKL
jgi:GDPmannose 4,6-dehydratase